MSDHCHYCQRRVFPAKSADGRANVHCVRSRDHVFPKRFVERHHRKTMPCVVACHGCNTVKNDAPYDVFMVFIRRMRGRPHSELVNEFASFRYLLMSAGLKAALADLENTAGPVPHLKLVGAA